MTQGHVSRHGSTLLQPACVCNGDIVQEGRQEASGFILDSWVSTWLVCWDTSSPLPSNPAHLHTLHSSPLTLSLTVATLSADTS